MEGPRHSKEVLDNSSNPESVPTSSTATVTGPSRKSPPVAVLVPSKKSPPSAALQSSPMEALVPTGKSLSVAEYVPTPNLVDKKNRQSWGRALHNSTYWQKMNKILFERRRLYLLKRALADLPIFASVFNYYSNNGNKKEPGTYVEVVHPPTTYDGVIYPEYKDTMMSKFINAVAFPGIGIPFVGTDSTKCRGSRTWTWWGTNSVPSSTTGSSTSTTTIIGETESNTRIGTDRTGKSTRNTIATS